MAAIVGREIHLKSHPRGMPNENDFELAEVSVPEPKEGEILVRNIYMTVDPYMRGFMLDPNEQSRGEEFGHLVIRGREGYGRPFQLGGPPGGGSVGQVVRSNSDQCQVGDYVRGYSAWREYFVSSAEGVTKIDQTIAPIQSFLGAVGMPGQTAYIGLLDIGEPKEGETVFVSAASGAVGSIVCQIAKIKGCRVVGSAGSDRKVSWLMETAGIDVAFNYKQIDNLEDELGRHCPDGIDVYFENVGGEHFEAAFELMNRFGRIALCGMISQYNDIEPTPGPKNLISAIRKRLKLQGFIVSDHMDRVPDFYADIRQWISEGKIKWEETIVEGLENAPQAFIALFKGENMGKMIVKIGPDSVV